MMLDSVSAITFILCLYCLKIYEYINSGLKIPSTVATYYWR